MTDRVLHIIRAPLGGAFRHVCDLAEYQAKQGIPVAVLCDDFVPNVDIGKRLVSLQAICELGVWQLTIPRSIGFGDFKAVRKIQDLCASGSSFSILHGHGAKGSAYARLVAPLVGAHAVCTPHGGALHYSITSPSGFVFLLLERLLKSKTSGMIFESEFSRQTYLEKIGSLRCPHQVIPNGIDDEEFIPIQNDAITHDFLFVGEFRELKGIFVLLEALKDLNTHRPVSLQMIGSGPDESKLRARIERLGLASVVTVSPPVYPARAAFGSARCLVAPSTKESFPYIVIEALAAKMPLLTTFVGGIPEIYGPFASELVAPGNARALANKMNNALKRPEDLETLAERLHERIAGQLKIPQMAQNITEFYRTCSGGVDRTY